MLKSEPNTIKSNPRPRPIKVICRVRPFMSNETQDHTVQVPDQNNLLLVNQRCPSELLKYRFDNCYHGQATQETIYKDNLFPILQDVFKGLDATVFCYGMTGAGKTHTIQGNAQQPGLIPRCMKDIFRHREEFLASALTNGKPHRFEVRLSYMEIYLESVFDLLRPRDKNSRAGLAVREDGQRNVFVSGLEIRLLDSLQEFELEYSKGCKNRATAVTLLNQESSRSHAILGVEITIEDSRSGKAFRSKLNMIDLAGSEDNRRTGNTNLRLNESSSINQSLHALGKVVDAINNRAPQIPYRDSKMTRILQSTLGGRSLGMMIVNIAPGKIFFPETHRALNFATKSKEIVNNTVFNEIIEPKVIRNVNLESLQASKKLLPRCDTATTLKKTNTKILEFSKKSYSSSSIKRLDPPITSDDKVILDLAQSLNPIAKRGNATALIEMADKFVSEHKYEDAMRCYRHSLIFVPDHVTALNGLQKLESKEIIKSSPSKKVSILDSKSLGIKPRPSLFNRKSIFPNLDKKPSLTKPAECFAKKFIPNRMADLVENKELSRSLTNLYERSHSNQSLDGLSYSKSLNEILSSPEGTPIAKRKIKSPVTKVLSDSGSDFEEEASSVVQDPSYSDFVLDSSDASSDSLHELPNKRRKKPSPKKPSLKLPKMNLITIEEDPELKAILYNSDHPLVALINMGKPDLLKGLWPHGLKTRQHIADFITNQGKITTLQDLIPAAITEKSLLKALSKLQQS